MLNQEENEKEKKIKSCLNYLIKHKVQIRMMRAQLQMELIFEIYFCINRNSIFHGCNIKFEIMGMKYL